MCPFQIPLAHTPLRADASKCNKHFNLQAPKMKISPKWNETLLCGPHGNWKLASFYSKTETMDLIKN